MKGRTKYILAFLFLILALFSANKMNGLHEQQALWGSIPMYLLIGIWGVCASLLFHKSEARPALFSTLAGVLLWLGFPPFPTPFFLLIGWVPLFLSIQSAKSGKRAFIYGLNTFAWWNMLTTFWVCNTALVAGLVAIFLNSLLMATTLWVYFILSKKVKPGMHFYLLVSCWISFEFLHHDWDIQWPWLTLGNGLSRFPSIVQWYEYTGVFGGSLWVLSVNWVLYKLTGIWKDKKQGLVKQGSIALVLIFIPVLFSLFLNSKSIKPTGSVQVAVVQPNFEPHYQKFDVNQKDQLERFLQLSEDIVDEETDYLVFPETSFSIRLNNWGTQIEVRELYRFLEQHPDLTLISGFESTRVLDENEETSPFTRIFKTRAGDTILWEVHNSAIQPGRKGDYQIYYKSKLVPGAEFFPFKSFLPFISGIVRKLGGSSSGLRMQKDRSALKNERGLKIGVGPVICYESIFGEYVSGYIRAGSKVLFIMTNDGWWDDTPGHKQHLYIGALRAIEQRKPIARSANTGISCFIDVKGRISQQTNYDEATAITQKIEYNDKITFYNQYGDMIARLSVLMLAGFLLVRVSNEIRNRVYREAIIKE